ncbi:hypothetical protein ARAM_005575 [Aspergillus rambellii]|uniref:GAR domain-containing protein n=1 Tax=Aspergillus rambellii TaxID=308745 RepID=A0A0F8XHG7_9EURO|nr:hypothetical protein ARAM_005575 [Aspergillus rambellii]
MATSRVTPPHRPIQPSPSATSQPLGSDRLAVPNYHTIDPLLGNLSPESTLQALSSTNLVPKNEQVAHDILTRSISQVSPAERALGIRAAIAAQKLGLWYKEVQAWNWPKRNDVHLGQGFIPPPDDTQPASCGSLPISVVEGHEKRIEEIQEGMDGLGVEELKEHVLNAHIPGRSRPSSSNSTMSMPPPLSYVQLSDFTAVITATILRALPLLSRLNSLLSTWNVRLVVLRQVPGLLHSLKFARSELNAALDLLTSSDPPTETDALYSTANYHVKRATLESTVVSAGRRMDRILDALEGREDSLPESWIDDLEAIESEFGTWVMQAEKRSVENEWRRLATSSTMHNRSEQTQRDLTEPKIQEPLVNTPSPALVESVSESAIVTCIPEPEPQPRLTPLQIGRTPMETIVEETGSPCRPTPPTTTWDHQAISPVTRENPLPAHPTSPSTLPTGDCEVHEPLFHASPIIDADEVCSAPAPAEMPQPDIGAGAHIAPSSVDESPVETASPLLEILPVSNPRGEEVSVRSSESGSQKPHLEELPPGTESDISSAGPSHDPPTQTEPTLQVVDDIPSPSLASNAQPQVSPAQELEADPKTLAPRLVDPSPEARCFPEEPIASVEDAGLPKIREEPEPITDVDDRPQFAPVKDTNTILANVVLANVTPNPPATISPIRGATSPVHHPVTSLLESPTLFIPFDSSKSPVDNRPVEVPEQPSPENTPKQHLESPIKLSKTRSGRPEHDSKKSRVRRTSHGSDGSLSDFPSLVSSPEIREPRTCSSNATPLLLETPPPPHTPTAYKPSDAVSPNSDHTLREDRLLRLDAQKQSPRDVFAHNRALSLPLQRFINERLEMNFEPGSGAEDSDAAAHLNPRLGQKESARRRDKTTSSTPTSDMRRLAGQHLAFTREESSGPESDSSHGVVPQEKPKTAISKNLSHAPPRSDSLGHIKAARLRKQLTAHPSLESIGAYKSRASFSEVPTTNPNLNKTQSRSSTPINRLLRPKDQMDEKINSILTTLPASIHLVPADQDDDGISVTSSLPFRPRERFRSSSPQGTPSRSGTPTPSLTLRPAVSRRRHSHAHAPEESSVKLYHLHRGGKSAPTKLFVRSVGETGERVMVRVGGGWADLGEYLREYAIHHGRRHVSETPRVEVEGISSRESPSYSPPGGRPPPPSSSGRHTPSRPRSVIGHRPSSSLALRKTRRFSNVSDMAEFGAVSAGEAPNVSFSPMSSSTFARRRLSVSSSVSLGAMSSVSEARYGSPSTIAGGASSHAIPLGLAGPNPRAKHASISPESEAWVEDILGQARRSSSLRPFKFGVPPQDNEPDANTPTLPKVRSISDIGKAGSSKRVALRGLGSR